MHLNERADAEAFFRVPIWCRIQHSFCMSRADARMLLRAGDASAPMNSPVQHFLCGRFPYNLQAAFSIPMHAAACADRPRALGPGVPPCPRDVTPSSPPQRRRHEVVRGREERRGCAGRARAAAHRCRPCARARRQPRAPDAGRSGSGPTGRGPQGSGGRRGGRPSARRGR